MKTVYFSHLYQLFLFLYLTYLPFLFVRTVCGKYIHVANFPDFMGFSDAPGWYYVESFVYSKQGGFEIGLELIADRVEYYSLSQIQITAFRGHFEPTPRILCSSD